MCPKGDMDSDKGSQSWYPLPFCNCGLHLLANFPPSSAVSSLLKCCPVNADSGDWRSPSLGDGGCRQDILPTLFLSCGCFLFLPLSSPTVGMELRNSMGVWLCCFANGRGAGKGIAVWSLHLAGGFRRRSRLGTYPYLPRGSSPTGESLE